MRKTGVGVVATQSFVNPSYGTEGIELMENGNSATEALEILTSGEDGRDVRQVAIADANGNVAACTGKMCIPYAGHIMGENFSVQANMMLTEAVPAAMAEAFNRNTQLPFAERVLSVLFAAQEAGGDIRGKQSAVLLVVTEDRNTPVWADKLIDLRVDDSEEPLKELKRLLKVHRAYTHMNNGDLVVERAAERRAAFARPPPAAS